MIPDSEGAALHRAVLRDPFDDTVRLVYADWLAESGSVNRHGFIRDQVAVPDECWFRPQMDLGVALLRPLDLYLEDATPGPNTAKLTQQGFIWHRGFLDEVRTTAEQFLEHAHALFDRYPLTAVRLTDREPLYVTMPYPQSKPSPTNREHYRWWPELLSNGRSIAICAYSIPRRLFDFLDGDQSEWRSVKSVGNWCWQYETRERAFSDLSRACVVYGRRLAGLPDLPTEHLRTLVAPWNRYV